MHHGHGEAKIVNYVKKRKLSQKRKLNENRGKIINIAEIGGYL